MTRPRPARHPAADRGGPVEWSAVERILAVRADNLGDVVMLTPALRALRRAAPKARIDLLASPAGAAVVPLLPGVAGVLTASVAWQQIDAGPVNRADTERDLVERLRAGRYDVMLVFTSPTQSPWPAAYAGLLAEIPVRAVHSAEFGGAVATHWITPPPDGTHQVDRCLHLLAALGVPPAGPALELRTPAGAGVDDPYVLLAPGGSCPSKRYPADRFGQAAGIVASAGIDVLVTGPPAERELIESVVDGAGSARVRPLTGLDVPALAAAVAGADVLLCNNSGCMHLADAVRVPVVVTYAGTERITDMGPRSTTSILLRQEVSCSPCRQFRCPYRQECLDVDPAVVAAAVLRLVSRLEACPA
ncbi:MAG: glycosyltransferase family 9 protein [Labedaea sp.]